MKTKTRKMVEVWEDPVVAEVREARAKLWKEGGNTVAGVNKLIKHRATVKKKTARKATRKAS